METADIQMGSALGTPLRTDAKPAPQALPTLLERNNSHVLADMFARGSIDELPKIQAVFEAARNSIEALDQEPLIQEEKLRRSSETLDRAFSQARELLAGEAASRLKSIDAEEHQLVAAARREVIPDTSSEVDRELLSTSRTLSDQRLIDTLGAEDVADFAEMVLLTEEGSYIRRVFPVLLQRTEAIATEKRKANPNLQGRTVEEQLAGAMRAKWTDWRRAHPTIAEQLRRVRAQREDTIARLQKSAITMARAYGFGTNAPIAVRTK